VATEEGKIDPMYQFAVEPLVPLQVGGLDISFTNSSLWLQSSSASLQWA
jgi:F-type H+-transporting ATPase subunit a